MRLSLLLNDLKHLLIQTLIAIISNIVFLPLSHLIPKKKNRIIVIGSGNGIFLDNTKHFFIFLCKQALPKLDVLFITANRDTISLLEGINLPIAYFPGLKTISYLLTANIIAVDCAEWIDSGKYHLGHASKIIQLWHGAPLKEIELPQFHRRLSGMVFPFRQLLQIQKYLTGRYPCYDVVLTTSRYITEHAFKSAFHAKTFLETGYPRNDILFSQTDWTYTDPVWLNTDTVTVEKVKNSKSCGKKIFFYMPTFRKSKECPIRSGVLDFHLLDRHLKEMDAIVVIKVHPYLANVFRPDAYENILCYKPTCDIYPALSLADCLITDYSSIYFDFLLLDRPIIFFTYDFESYVGTDRALLFDFNEFAPGSVCTNQSQLEYEMRHYNNDAYKTKRAQVRKKIFDYTDGDSSKRVWQHLSNEYCMTKNSLE